MRIGSIVTKIRLKESGNIFREEWHVPDDSLSGTLIEIEVDDCDGYDVTKSVTIRWSDGSIETSEIQGEDDIGAWEIADATPKLYANIYLHDRAYGGPEEGGWWYDTYTPAINDWDTDPPLHGHFKSEEEAENAIVALQAWCDSENKLRRNPSSVLSDGHFVVRLESWPSEPEPKHKPYYC